MPEEHGAISTAVGDGRADVVDVLEPQGLGPGDADDCGDLRDADGDGGVGQRRAEDRGQADREHQERERQHGVGEPGDGAVREPAVVAADQAEGYAYDEGQHDGDEADLHGGACPVNDAGELVASEVVGAEPVGPAGFGEYVPEVRLGGVVRGDQWREERGEDEDGGDDAAGEGEPVLAQGAEPAAAGPLPGGLRGGGERCGRGGHRAPPSRMRGSMTE